MWRLWELLLLLATGPVGIGGAALLLATRPVVLMGTCAIGAATPSRAGGALMHYSLSRALVPSRAGCIASGSCAGRAKLRGGICVTRNGGYGARSNGLMHVPVGGS